MDALINPELDFLDNQGRSRPDWSELSKRTVYEKTYDEFKVKVIEPLLMSTIGAAWRYGDELVIPCNDYFKPLAENIFNSTSFNATDFETIREKSPSPYDFGTRPYNDCNDWTFFRITDEQTILAIHENVSGLWETPPNAIRILVPTVLRQVSQEHAMLAIRNFLGYIFHKAKHC